MLQHQSSEETGTELDKWRKQNLNSKKIAYPGIILNITNAIEVEN